MPEEISILHQLMQIIQQRRDDPSEKSYTSKLLAGGVDRIAAKIREESEELIEAASEKGDEGRAHLVYESADLIYHLFVMLGLRDVELEEVEAELKRRFGISGLEEKASRNQ